MTRRYELIKTEAGPAIKCLTCGRVSHNPHDVKERYCPSCHVFHEIAAQGEEISRKDGA